MKPIDYEKLEDLHLRKRYIDDLATVQEIAAEAQCSVHLVKKRLKEYRILRGKALQKKGVVAPWNKGRTKETDPRLAALSEMHTGEGNPMSNRTAWNKGLSAEDDPRVMAISDALRGREVSGETREKMAAAKRGKVREESNRWSGGVAKSGRYHEHRKTVDGRRMYVHRYVAEQYLGRKLERLEHVHHIDRTELNNDPENLMVLSEKGHARLHGAIYRGECDSRSEQIEWLNAAGIKYITLV